MTNINNIVWRYVDRNFAIKKCLLGDLINMSALARKIAVECKLENHIDAIITALRRYSDNLDKKGSYAKIQDILYNTQISANTKIASIFIRRDDISESKVNAIYSKIKLKRTDSLRILTIINYINIIVNEELVSDVQSIFPSSHIVRVTKNLAEVIINYNKDITRIPGVFATLYNELALNNISVLDSIIGRWEHILVVDEKDLEKSFNVLLGLTKKV